MRMSKQSGRRGAGNHGAGLGGVLRRLAVGAVAACVALGAQAADVTFNDAGLLQAIQETFAANGWPLGDPPQDTELGRPDFTEFYANGRNIGDLTGLEACVSLEVLSLNGNAIADLSPLSGLANLTELRLGRNQISDLTPLSGLTGLERLDVGVGFNPLEEDEDEFEPPFAGFNQVADIGPLGTLVNLQYLGLVGNDGLTDLAALATMANLETLWLGGSPIADFSQLTARAASLNALFLLDVGLADGDLGAIGQLTNLAFLGMLLNPGVTDLSPLSTLNLTGFLLFEMENVTSLAVASNWVDLALLLVQSTPLTAAPDLSGAGGVGQVVFEDTQLADITALSGSTIEFLGIFEAPLADLAGLEGVLGLQGISLGFTQVTDLQPLLDAAAGGLEFASIRGNPLSEQARCEQIPALLALLPGPDRLQTDAICGDTATLTVNITGVGEVGGNLLPDSGGTVQVPLGSNYNVDARPVVNSGHAFSHWEGDLGGANPTDFNITLSMDTDRTIEAVFVTPGDFTLTISRTGPASSEVFPGLGTVSYLSGQRASAFALANGTTSFFAGWTGAVTSATPGIQVEMDGNKSITANFTASGFTLQLSVVGGGGVNNLGPGSYAFATNTVVPLDAFGFTGWRFDRWEGDLGGADPNDPNIEVVMNQNRSVTLYLEQGDRQLTVLTGGTGSGTTQPSGTTFYFENDTAFVSATANPGSVFLNWEGDIGGNNPTNPFLSLPMTQDRTVTAIFGPAYTLTIQSQGAGTTFPVPGAYSFAEGATGSASAQPAPGGTFLGWQGDIGDADPQAFAIDLPMTQDRTITAVFAEYDWTVTVNKVGTGTVSREGSFGVFDGETVGLLAEIVAGSGFAFAGWTGDIASDANFITFTAESDVTVTANFTDQDVFTLTLDAGTGGTTFPAPGQYAYLDGQQALLSAVPAFSYSFAAWTGDLGDAEPGSNPVVLTMDQDRSVSATFTQGQIYTLTINSTGQGQTLPAAGQSYVYLPGAIAFVIAEGSGGEVFNRWEGDIGDADPKSPSLNLPMDQDREITALFGVPDHTLTVRVRGTGAVSPNRGVYPYFTGDVVNLSASEIFLSGYNFVGWAGDLGGADPASPAITVTMDQDRVVTALFEPADAILCQQVAAGLNPFVSNEGPDFFTYDSFEVSAPIGGVRWWGIQGADPGSGFQPCQRDPDAFEIVFFADDGGQPGAEVYSEVIAGLTGQATGEQFFDYPVYEYAVTLTASFALASGWISIRGIGDEDCWFLWSSSDRGDGRTWQQNPEGVLSEKPVDSAFCLIEGPAPPPQGHRADQNGDGRINLSELLRVIQFYNSAGYRCAAPENPTEDGYVPGTSGAQDCFPHSSDYNPQDWIINLSELLRLIQFYNSLGFEPCPDAVPPTEDGFCVLQD